MKLTSSHMFRNMLRAFQWILIFLSVCSVIFCLLKAGTFKWELTYEGLLFFLNIFSPFNLLFASTFIVIATIYSHEQLSMTQKSNVNFIKVNARNQWIAFITPHIDTLSHINSSMKVDLLKKLVKIHDYLYATDYKITGKKHLSEFFDTFLKSKVESFETGDWKWWKIGVYSDKDWSYSRNDFTEVFLLMIDDENSYADLRKDLYDIYSKQVLVFSEPFIQKDEFAKRATKLQREFEQENNLTSLKAGNFL